VRRDDGGIRRLETNVGPLRRRQRRRQYPLAEIERGVRNIKGISRRDAESQRIAKTIPFVFLADSASLRLCERCLSRMALTGFARLLNLPRPVCQGGRRCVSAICAAVLSTR